MRGTPMPTPLAGDRVVWMGLPGILMVLGVGCAPSLSTMMPAQVTPKGRFQVSTSVDVADTQGGIRDAVDDLLNLEISESVLSEEELNTVVAAGEAVMVQPPSLGAQIGVAYGASDWLEVGLRTSVNTIRGWIRWQFLQTDFNVYGSFGSGLSGYLYGFPVHQFSSDVTLQSYRRMDLDFPLLFGYSGRIFHLWGGPKIIFSNYQASLEVCVKTGVPDCEAHAQADFSGDALYFAGQLGGALGYGGFWVTAELTMAQIRTETGTTVTTTGSTEEQTIKHTGLVLSPSLGFLFRF